MCAMQVFGILLVCVGLVLSDTQVCQDQNGYYVVKYGAPGKAGPHAHQKIIPESWCTIIAPNEPSLYPPDRGCVWRASETIAKGPPGSAEGGNNAVIVLSGEGVKIGGKVFVSSGSIGPYETAKRTCRRAGGQLPTPQNDAENKAVLFFRQKYGNRNPFVGANDREEEGVYRDQYGNPQSYLPWVVNSPDNAGDVEDCVEIIDDEGKWNDIDCKKPHLTVCEFKFGKV